MKLLSKNEIQQKKSIERKLEIDEGAKLARKVDSLRETAAEEEIRLEKFRTESVKKLHEEIVPLTKERDDLIIEISDLKEKRRILQIPLDAAREEVRIRNTELDAVEKTIAEKSALLDQREIAIREREEAIILEEQRAAGIKDRANGLLSQANHIMQSVRGKDAAADKKMMTMAQYVDRKNKELKDREADVAVREREIQIKSENLETKAKALADWERQINDKYETLSRTLKRNNHA